MRILVVGGAGYVGGAVTDLLAQPHFHPSPIPGEVAVNFAGATEHQFRVYDSLLYEDQYRKPVAFTRGDIRDRQRLLPLLQWADAVIWLAAIVGDAACALDPVATFEINEAAVRWLSNNFSGRIIFLSTCSVYGQGAGELTEESPTNPLSVYATTKLAAERILADHQNALCFRLGTLFGLSDHFSRVRFDLVVNTLTLRAHQTGKITVFGGQQYRPLLHVRDAAQAIVSALDHPATGIYNLRYKNLTISDIADEVSASFPDLEVSRVPQYFEDNRNYRVSNIKAERELRFYPRRTIDDGVREIRDLLSSGRLTDPSAPRYWNHHHLALAREKEVAAR